MQFMNKTQIVKAFKQGQIDLVWKQVRLCGGILKDKAWEQEDGCHRVMHIMHHGYEWKGYMHNGDVTRLSMTEHH